MQNSHFFNLNTDLIKINDETYQLRRQKNILKTKKHELSKWILISQTQT